MIQNKLKKLLPYLPLIIGIIMVYIVVTSESLNGTSLGLILTVIGVLFIMVPIFINQIRSFFGK